MSFKKELEDHEKLKSITTPEEFKKLLDVPEEVEEDFDIMLKPLFNNTSSSIENIDGITEISPSTAKKNINIRLFRWLIQSLLHKEGPLVSMDEAALRLGISKDYFESICERFELAKYNGIFNHSHRRLWWSCLLEDYVLELEDEHNLLSKHSFLEASSMLLGATTSKNQSKCIVCHERYPDSLGIIVDDDEKSLYQVHIVCSELNDSLKQEPFFRNPRIIDGE